MSATAVKVDTPTGDASTDCLFAYCLELGDNALILGQRLAEWSSKAPNLEIDIALSNHSLDLFGQASMLYSYAAEVEGKDRDEDALAFLRDVSDFRNVLLVEQPNGDFADTIVRHVLYTAFAVEQYDRLAISTDARLAAIGAKAVKELSYHLRHTGEWLVRLGDGTDESHERAQKAVDNLWPYTGELFASVSGDAAIKDSGIGPDPSELKTAWDKTVDGILERATLTRPADGWMQAGGREGRHSEHLGYMLADMQFMQRAYPGAKW